MLGLIRNNLLDLLLIALGGSLVYNQATWPAAIVMVSIIGIKAYEKYAENHKKLDMDNSTKERLASIESKLAMMSLSKR